MFIPPLNLLLREVPNEHTTLSTSSTISTFTFTSASAPLSHQ